MASTRLPAKMLLPLGGQALLMRAYCQALHSFAAADVVIATPIVDASLFHAVVPNARVYGYTGDASDVLGRLAACARAYADVTHVARWTPDDWRKNTRCVRESAFDGEIHPAAQSIERFTIADLHAYDAMLAPTDPAREHVGLLHPANARVPHADGLPWSIDVLSDYLTVAALHTRRVS